MMLNSDNLIVTSIMTFTYSDILQVTGGTSAAGNAHQIWSTWFHLPSFWLADSLCNVFSAPFGISAPIGLVWKFSVGMHGVTYLVVIHLVFTFFIFQCSVFMSVIVLARVGYPLRTGVVGPFLMLCLFCVMFLVHMLCGSCTGRKRCFACGVNVFIVTNFVGKWI